MAFSEFEDFVPQISEQVGIKVGKRLVALRLIKI